MKERTAARPVHRREEKKSIPREGANKNKGNPDNLIRGSQTLTLAGMIRAGRIRKIRTLRKMTLPGVSLPSTNLWQRKKGSAETRTGKRNKQVPIRTVCQRTHGLLLKQNGFCRAVSVLSCKPFIVPQLSDALQYIFIADPFSCFIQVSKPLSFPFPGETRAGTGYIS